MEEYNNKNTECSNYKSENKGQESRKKNVNSDVFADFDYDKIMEENKNFNKKIVATMITLSVVITLAAMFLFNESDNSSTIVAKNSREAEESLLKNKEVNEHKNENGKNENEKK